MARLHEICCKSHIEYDNEKIENRSTSVKVVNERTVAQFLLRYGVEGNLWNLNLNTVQMKFNDVVLCITSSSSVLRLNGFASNKMFHFLVFYTYLPF